jgi:hypothetical protein
MVKLLSPLAALLLISVSARAQVVVGAAAEAGAWVGPMAAAVTAAGSERISSLGYTSLTNLSSPDAKGRLPFVAEPLALAPLAQAVRAQGLTPQTFAALPTAEKLTVLTRAAVPAEAHAAAVADEALAAVAEPVRIGTYMDASKKVANAADVSLYLRADRAEKVAAAVTAVKTYEKRRSQLIKAFLEDLPGKIAAGEINGGNIIGRDADGWYAADESPEQRYATVNELYRSRLDRLGRGAYGPWTIRQSRLLKAALRNQDVAEALSAEHRGSPEATPAPAALARFMDMHAKRGWESFAGDPKLKGSIQRFQKGAARGTDVRKIEKFYDSALNRAAYGSTTMSWLAAAIHNGSDGVPGWEELKSIKREAQKGYQRNALRGMVGFIAAMATMVLTGVSDWPNAAKLAAFAAMWVPMGWMFLNIWRRDAYGFEADNIDRAVDRLRPGFDD